MSAVLDTRGLRAGALARRARFLRALRAAHGWLGLWGAVMGLFFGATGIVMNHRAILKLPLKKFEQTVVQVELAEPARSPEDLARQLAERLELRGRAPLVRVEPAEVVRWNGREVWQPERWTVAFDGPQRFTRAEYWAGNRTVKLTRSEANLIATLARLHMAVGVDALWVLIVDTVAGSLILLSITGLILRSQLRPWRMASLATALGAASLALWQALRAL